MKKIVLQEKLNKVADILLHTDDAAKAVASQEQHGTNEKLFKNWRPEIIYPLLSGFLSLVIVSFVLNLSSIDLRVPFTMAGDALGGLASAQMAIRGDAAELFNLGVGISLIQRVVTWGLSLFIHESGLLTNIFYIITFFTTAVAATYALRLLHIRPILAILGGCLYTFLPYHFFRGLSHLWLSTYAIVPLVCVVMLWVCTGELELKSKYKSKIIISFLVILILSMTNSAISFLAGMVLAFAALWNIIEMRSLRKAVVPIALCVSLVLFVCILLLPFFLSILGGGVSPMEGSRELRHVEIFSLRFIELILPVRGHRISIFQNFRDFYVNDVSLVVQESTHSSGLGVLGGLGLIISLFVAVRKKADEKLRSASVLNVFMLILGASGGISSLIIMFFSYQRTYNRLSIFIAFYSLFVVLFLIDKLLKKNIFSQALPGKICSIFLIVFIGAVSMLDLIPDSSEGRVFDLNVNNQNVGSWYNDRDFVRRIEEMSPDGTKVFQLPFIPMTHHVAYHRMPMYEHRRPFLHSTTINWAFRSAALGSKLDLWQNAVSALPTELMLKHLAANDYRGLYIDTRGYVSEEFAWQLVEEISAITGETPIVSEHGFMVYFLLDSYADFVKENWPRSDHVQWESYPDINFSPDIAINEYFSAVNQFGGLIRVDNGWHHVEQWIVWSDGNSDSAVLDFIILDENIREKNLTLNFEITAVANPLIFRVYVNGKEAADEELSQERMLVIPVTSEMLIEENSAFSFNIRFEIENPISPKEVGINDDTRILGLGLISFTVEATH